MSKKKKKIRSHPVRSFPSVEDDPTSTQASVTQPWLASVTDLMYLYSVPWETLSGGAFHSFLLLSSSSGETRSSMVFLTASTEIRSPSCTKAIGPPTWASGTTWPMQNPWDLEKMGGEVRYLVKCNTFCRRRPWSDFKKREK